MAGRGPQTFKKKQKEQQRKERQQEKLAKKIERKQKRQDGVPEDDNTDDYLVNADLDRYQDPDQDQEPPALSEGERL